MTDIHLHIDTDDCLKMLHQAPEQVIAALQKLVIAASVDFQAKAIQEAPQGATGLLQKSIQAQATKTHGDKVTGGIETANPYAAAVEYGTRPHFPPVAPLKLWVKAKLGITNEAEITSAAYGIARKISKHGTKPQKFIERATDKMRPDFARKFEKTVEVLIKRIDRGQQ